VGSGCASVSDVGRVCCRCVVESAGSFFQVSSLHMAAGYLAQTMPSPLPPAFDAACRGVVG
jgi:hypothetical protein